MRLYFEISKRIHIVSQNIQSNIIRIKSRIFIVAIYNLTMQFDISKEI